jgi:RNA recognition motif-containing protein
VFVGNLSYDVTRDELLEVFGAAGKVVDAKVPTDRETGRPRGFAFVEFDTDESAARSIELLNGKYMKGRPLRVNEADNRPPRPGGPGGPGGGSDRPFRPSFRPDGPRPGGGRPGGGFGGPGRGRPFLRGDEIAFPPPDAAGREDRRARGAGRAGAPKNFKDKAPERSGRPPKPKTSPKKKPKGGKPEDWDDFYDE